LKVLILILVFLAQIGFLRSACLAGNDSSSAQACDDFDEFKVKSELVVGAHHRRALKALHNDDDQEGALAALRAFMNSRRYTSLSEVDRAEISWTVSELIERQANADLGASNDLKVSALKTFVEKVGGPAHIDRLAEIALRSWRDQDLRRILSHDTWRSILARHISAFGDKRRQFHIWKALEESSTIEQRVNIAKDMVESAIKTKDTRFIFESNIQLLDAYIGINDIYNGSKILNEVSDFAVERLDQASKVRLNYLSNSRRQGPYCLYVNSGDAAVITKAIVRFDLEAKLARLQSLALPLSAGDVSLGTDNLGALINLHEYAATRFVNNKLSIDGYKYLDSAYAYSARNISHSRYSNYDIIDFQISAVRDIISIFEETSLFGAARYFVTDLLSIAGDSKNSSVVGEALLVAANFEPTFARWPAIVSLSSPD